MFLLLPLACAPLESNDVRETGGALDTAEAADITWDTASDPPGWSEVFPLLEARCGGCHQSDYIGRFVVPGDASATYTRLLGEEAVQDEGRFYVVPGDLSASLLIEKIGDDPEFGDAMPPEGQRDVTPLGAHEIGMIRAWVEAGAPE